MYLPPAMRWICALVFSLAALQAQTMHFDKSGEYTGEIEMRAPGTDWGTPGHEAALATVLVDDKPLANIMLYMGAQQYPYSVFLGRVEAGDHKISVTGPGVEVAAAHFREDDSAVLAHTPILYARPNTIGKFTDIPLVMYCERLEENGVPYLQYSVIYSNEDGGTPTRVLMARWGRTTDIEWIYKAFLTPDGSVQHGTIQSARHKEREFRGRMEGTHPVLITWTDNNNVSDGATSAVRYQIPPVLTDLSRHSREELMDEKPFTYVVMAKELARENNLRPYGTVDGQKISDPRNYLDVEMEVRNRDAAVNVLARLRSGNRWFASDLGHADYAISRDGWVRTTIELPPGTKPGDLAGVGFECVTQKEKLAGTCEVLNVSKLFFLDGEYRPGQNLWTLPEKLEIPAGQMWESPVP